MNSHSEIVEQNEWIAACLDLRRCFVARESPSPELAGRLARAEQTKRDRQANDANCAHNVMARAFGLSATQLELVWLSVALATDAEVQARAAELGLATNEIEIEAARQIIYGSGLRADALDELCDTATPFRLGLLERTDAGKPNTPFGKQTWACSRRLLTWLFGHRDCAPELARFASCPPDAKALSELHLPGPSIESARSAVVARRAIIVASGSPSLGRRTLLRAAAKEANIAVLEIDADQLAKDHEQLARQLKLIARECKLLERAPLVRDIDKLVDDHDQTRVDMVGSELVGELDGVVLVTCGVQRPAMRWDRPCVVVEVKQPTSLQRGAFWLECLGQGTEDDVQFLANNYPLAPALIHAAARAATSRANGRSIQPEDIFAGIRAVLDDRLGDFAMRIEVSQTWGDLVLPTDQLDAINYLLARIRQRRTVYEQWGYAAKVGKGLGTSALFSGPPGTGKTMVAALIAEELGLDLYQVDISKVVSKWIGETERNLATLFDAAEAGGAIILFDEADSLFGKRTEVKSSNDRYANLETNYLLQRLESFTGICLLTSNHESSIDPAFQRRLSLHLRFELPEADEREQLWSAMIPPEAPVAPHLDLRGLGQRFVMSGGYIRNAALRAAFMAADEGASITTRHLELAARQEYEGMGKIVGTHVRCLA